jgi:ribosomal protein S18 acetylase RimI-like enzyme
VRRLEELSLNAWPALETTLLDGWLVRFAEGYTRRANSVQPLYPPLGSVRANVEACAAAYSARGQDAIFKLTPASEPAGLDELLTRLGYAREAPTSVQTTELTGLADTDDAAVTLCEAAQADWLDAFLRLGGTAAEHRPTMTRMFERMTPSHVFAALRVDGQIVSVGLAVAEAGLVGMYDVVTDASARNRGFGRRLVRQLMRWGRAQGAERAYLSVMADNAPALHLYAALGFRERYVYWYRRLARAG